MAVKGIDEIAGKTIERVIVKKAIDPWSHPGIQVFFVFTDQTYYELYSDDISFTGGVDQGGRDAVLNYMKSSMRVVYEGFLDEAGKPTFKIPS